MSKYDMLSVKEIAFVAGNKELDVRFRKQSSCLSQFSFRGSYLAAIGIRTRVGHRQQSCLRVLCNKVFVLKSFSVNAHGACSISLWTFRITTISYLAASYQLLTFKKSPPWTMKSLITLKCNNPSEYITMKWVNILSLFLDEPVEQTAFVALRHTVASITWQICVNANGRFHYSNHVRSCLLVLAGAELSGKATNKSIAFSHTACKS